MARISFAMCAMLAVIQVARTANVTCYNCNSSTDPSCKDPFTATNTTTCSDACVKAKLGSVVTRGCSGSGSGDRCFTLLGAGTCICSKDLCNIASQVTVTMGTMIIVSTFFLVSKMI
ncbi:protein quiver-like [Dreissena polymorpha]|uniref:Protein quiver n=1 Tax=Dreissena polymorpha TaxID=45954 RepID=A0A9D4NCN5_DREPO|nr:protein quiver-like [Dreissena polymorpha]KAH3891970.1 hypothetical protein DPMN_016080 [Dreissena polymorpha]